VSATPLTVEELHADFAAELRVAFMITTRMANVNDRPSVEPQCVSGARVLVFVELFDPVCVWSASVRGLLVTYCSCGGVLGSGRRSFTGEKIEHVNVQVARRKSSTCRHASALQMAYSGIAAEHEIESLDELIEAFPALAGDGEDLQADVHAETAVHLALLAGKKANVPILAVSYEGIWSPAIVRRQGNKHKLVTCFLLSCASQPWGCIHAQAVNEYNRLGAAASSAAAAELQEALEFGPSDYLDDGDEEQNDEGDDQAGGEPGGPARPVNVAPPAPLPLPVRRSRNMFPCPVEVPSCNQNSDFIDSCVQAGEPKTMHDTHAEPICLRCNMVRDESTRVEPEETMLYTVRGWAKIHIGTWYCSTCKLSVVYDGALNGLFVETRDTVYARFFLDAMLELCVIARSTMAAASEYLASFLGNTATYGKCEPVHARQLLSNACGEFSHTLIIPDAAFRCHYCGAEERTGGRFRCVISDGQVLSVLQQHVVSMLRPGMISPRVDFSLIFACALRSAKMRRLVRNHVRAPITDDTALTTARASAWSVFAAARLAVPPTGGRDVIAARTPTEKTAALLWSPSILFSSFYEVVGSGEWEQAPVVPRKPARGAVVDLFAAAEHASDGDDLDSNATSSVLSRLTSWQLAARRTGGLQR